MATRRPSFAAGSPPSARRAGADHQQVVVVRHVAVIGARLCMLRPPGYDQPVATRTPTEDIVQEAQAVMDASDQGAVGARLLGGIAIRLRTPGGLHPAFERSYKDIDLVAPRRSGQVALSAHADRDGVRGQHRLQRHQRPTAGCSSTTTSTAARSTSSSAPSRCATRSRSGDRLDVDALTVPLAELLLTKLQIVELNEKDRRDSSCSSTTRSPTPTTDAVNSARVADLLRGRLGLWRTTTTNLADARRLAPSTPSATRTGSASSTASPSCRRRSRRRPRRRAGGCATAVGTGSAGTRSPRGR